MSSTKLLFRVGTGFAVPAACATALLIPAGAALASVPPADTSQPTGQVWTLQNQNSGMMADDPGWSTAPGTAVDQWPATGGDNQSWVITASSGGYSGDFTIASRYSGLCLSDAGVMFEPCAAVANEEWQLTWTGPMNNGHRDAQLRGVASGEYLDSDSTQGDPLGLTPDSSDPAATWILGLAPYTFLTNPVNVPQSLGAGPYYDTTIDTNQGPPVVGYNCQPDYHFRMSSGVVPVYQSTGRAPVYDAAIWAEPVPSPSGWSELDPADAEAGLGHLDIEYTQSGNSAATGQIQVYCDVNSGVDS
jgi:Ricin-type beta-trefoil lectin domain-like